MHLTFGDIIENIDRIRSHVGDMSRDDFSNDQKTVDATERCLSRISEAAVKLGDAAESLAPGLPWGDIRGLGNHLRHSYRGVRADDIWKIVSQELEPLRAACTAARDKLKPAEN